MESELWFVYALVTTLCWGVWGAFIERPEKNGFPATLGYAVWALTMVYAFRHGQVIIVSPMINALAPVITIVLSLVLYRVVPHRVVVAGMALAAVAFCLMA